MMYFSPSLYDPYAITGPATNQSILGDSFLTGIVVAIRTTALKTCTKAKGFNIFHTFLPTPRSIKVRVKSIKTVISDNERAPVIYETGAVFLFIQANRMETAASTGISQNS